MRSGQALEDQKPHAKGKETEVPKKLLLPSTLAWSGQGN